VSEQGGWHPDPTGRFGQRWFDGSRWTDHVVSARGEVVTDTVPDAEQPLAPPRPVAVSTPPPPPSTTGAPPPAWIPAGPSGRPGAPGPQPVVAYRPGTGLALGLLGVLLTALSLIVVPWGEGDDNRFTDVSGALRDAGSAAVDDVFLYTYGAWAAFGFLLVGAVLVVMACVPLPASAAGNTYARVLGAGVTGLAAMLHGYFLQQLYPGDLAPELGAWLGLAGFLLSGVGMVVGARRVLLTTGDTAGRPR